MMKNGVKKNTEEEEKYLSNINSIFIIEELQTPTVPLRIMANAWSLTKPQEN